MLQIEIASKAAFGYGPDQEEMGPYRCPWARQPSTFKAMHYLFSTFLLAVFWLLLSGYFTALLLSSGLLSVLLVVWFLRRMDRVDREPGTLYPTGRFLTYIAWLMGCVVKANIDLARRIWDPRLPIKPNWTRLETTVSTPLEKTIYAYSITLTPGTLTTDVHDNHFLIHALSQEGIDELREGEMERRIRRLGV
ncbi:MAG: Na+/H+ antiporter subunit E [Chromatiaceae bacterium]|nr:Na+/H+ antiporter subunit E [Chromatiaceae bacterium]